MIEIKCTINVRHLDHPQTVPCLLWVEKLSSVTLVPGAKMLGLLLLEPELCTSPFFGQRIKFSFTSALKLVSFCWLNGISQKDPCWSLTGKGALTRVAALGFELFV